MNLIANCFLTRSPFSHYWRHDMRTIAMILSRVGLITLAGTLLALLFLSVSFVRILRRVTPWVLTGLPPAYRKRVLSALVTPSMRATAVDD